LDRPIQKISGGTDEYLSVPRTWPTVLFPDAAHEEKRGRRDEERRQQEAGRVHHPCHGDRSDLSEDFARLFRVRLTTPPPIRRRWLFF